MGMKPETRYLNRIRKIFKDLVPGIQIYKHADKFNAGIADLHLSFPDGITVWMEGKWVPSITSHRKVDLTDLQQEFLKEHAGCQIPAYVIVGSPHGTTFIHISKWTGEVRKILFMRDKDVVAHFITNLRNKIL